MPRSPDIFLDIVYATLGSLVALDTDDFPQLGWMDEIIKIFAGIQRDEGTAIARSVFMELDTSPDRYGYRILHPVTDEPEEWHWKLRQLRNARTGQVGFYRDIAGYLEENGRNPMWRQ